MIEIKYKDPDDGRDVVREWSYDDRPFIVGRSETSTVAFAPTDLSRFALLIAEHADTRLKIECRQRAGYVQVTRADGVRKATLADGDELLCGAGTYTVLLRTASQDILETTVVVPDRPRIVNPGIVTVGMWSRSQIFNPTPEEDWRWLAALTTVAVRTKARHPGKALQALAKAWHDGKWNANMQGRLDKVIDRLRIAEVDDKQQAIAAFVRSSGVIQPADYVAFRDEVQRRALLHLDRAEIGLLNWGYLTRGA